ncbi:MAG: ABC transporter permease subunit, partial [Deltaproteobacteria bacterium]
MTQENFLNQSFEAFQQPSKIYWMGTDDLGRDLWTGVVQGLQNSLIIGLGVTLLAYSVGLLLGITSGFFGGFTDTLILKLSEIIMVLPRFLIVILAASLLGQGVLILIITLGLFSWTTIYRIVRSEVLSLKRREYI